MTKPRVRPAITQPVPDRMDDAQYIKRDPETAEVSWPPTGMLQELVRLRLLS